jgi:hypothetical protein
MADTSQSDQCMSLSPSAPILPISLDQGCPRTLDPPAYELDTREAAQALGRVGQARFMHSRRDGALWYSELANTGKRLGRDGHLGGLPPPANVTVYDVTDLLGGEGVAVHGRYLERDGAEAIGLGMLIRLSTDRRSG